MTLRLSGRDEPIRRFQHAAQPLTQPVGSDVSRWFAAQELLSRHPAAEVLMLPWRCASDADGVPIVRRLVAEGLLYLPD